MTYPTNQPSFTPRQTSQETPPAVFTRASRAVPTGREMKATLEGGLRKPVSFASRLPPEPEDAHLTGATRSLSRRLLALNLRKAC